MKPTIVTWAAALTVVSGVWLYAQESDSARRETSSASAETPQSTRCEAMCVMKHSSQNPANLLAWNRELNLTDEQRTRLRAIEEKASSEAKDLLTVEQHGKLKELATPESMMQCMRSSTVSAGCSEMHKAEEPHSSH
jgi:Spy/CpxP family protein refolding chaperone